MPENPLSTITKLDPLFMEQMKKLDDFIYGEGVLPRKFKYLIAMAFDAVDGAGDGVGFLARAAMREGATKEEIAETLRVAAHLGGVGCLYTASEALKDLFP